VDFIGTDDPLFDSFVCNFVGACNTGSVTTGVDLGVLRTGDTLSYVYTLTAQGTTHGFERGYDAFLGDPFGVDVVGGNLGVSVSLADSSVPEPGTFWIGLLGVAGVCVSRRQTRRSCITGPPK
jgi:PEP-CTERM motif